MTSIFWNTFNGSRAIHYELSPPFKFCVHKVLSSVMYYWALCYKELRYYILNKVSLSVMNKELRWMPTTLRDANFSIAKENWKSINTKIYFYLHNFSIQCTVFSANITNTISSSSFFFNRLNKIHVSLRLADCLILLKFAVNSWLLLCSRYTIYFSWNKYFSEEIIIFQRK